MSPIAAMPCVGVIQTDTPGYRPCEDCQGKRHLCGMPSCERAPDMFAEASGPESADESQPVTVQRPPVPPWRKAPTAPRPGPDGWSERGAPKASAAGDRVDEFEAWLRERGYAPKTVRDAVSVVRRGLQAGVRGPDDVSGETLPGLSRSSLAVYRGHFRRYLVFLAETPHPPPDRGCSLGKGRTHTGGRSDA